MDIPSTNECFGNKIQKSELSVGTHAWNVNIFGVEG